jgi:hypothetical protein
LISVARAQSDKRYSDQGSNNMNPHCDRNEARGVPLGRSGGRTGYQPVKIVYCFV